MEQFARVYLENWRADLVIWAAVWVILAAGLTRRRWTAGWIRRRWVGTGLANGLDLTPTGSVIGTAPDGTPIDNAVLAQGDRAGVDRVSDLSSSLEELGGGVPKLVLTPKGATQFIFPNGMILRFDLQPGQYLNGQSPHINIEYNGDNIHIPMI